MFHLGHIHSQEDHLKMAKDVKNHLFCLPPHFSTPYLDRLLLERLKMGLIQHVTQLPAIPNQFCYIWGVFIVREVSYKRLRPFKITHFVSFRNFAPTPLRQLWLELHKTVFIQPLIHLPTMPHPFCYIWTLLIASVAPQK